MNLLKIAKLAGKITTPEDALELLSGMGIDLQITPIAPGPEEAIAHLELFAAAHVGKGGKLFKLTAASDGRPPLYAFVVMGPEAVIKTLDK